MTYVHDVEIDGPCHDPNSRRESCGCYYNGIQRLEMCQRHIDEAHRRMTRWQRKAQP